MPTTKWTTGDQGAYPPEPGGWAKMPGCKPVFYFADGFTYVADGNEEPETIWHQVGYPPKQRDDVIALHTSTGLWPAKFGDKDWVWCFWNDHECRWQIVASYEDHWRFQLLEPLPRCGSALAKLVLWDGVYCPVDLTFTVTDSIGVLFPEDIDQGSSGGPVVVPAGTYGFAKHFADSDKWEVLALGEGCCPKSSSSSSRSSSSKSSPSSRPSSFSSTPSSPSSPSTPSSEPSAPSSTPSSRPPSSAPSSQPSSPPSSEPSDQPPSPSSQPSQSPPSESPESQSPESQSPESQSPESQSPKSHSPQSRSPQSEKSTAIVPASWSPTGYTALFIHEMPEVRFDDVLTATVTEEETLIPIDPRFLEVCEPGSVEVCGCVPDLPIPVGAVVENDQVRIRTSGLQPTASGLRIVLRLTGIRKGFSSQRFPNRSEEQFLANEAFIRSAYPGGHE